MEILKIDQKIIAIVIQMYLKTNDTNYDITVLVWNQEQSN
jgi:hypothetical protein